MSVVGYTKNHLLLFLSFVTIFIALSTECIRSSPVLLDEFAHVPVGVSHWQLGRYYLYRENPPFVRLLTSFPVLLSKPAIDYRRAKEGHRSEWMVGVDFLAANQKRYDILIDRARCVSLFLAISCSCLIFWWVSSDYGGVAGIACAAIWLTDPTALTHSAIAGIDLGTATFACFATYTFWLFLRNPGWVQTFWAGLFLGIAESCKFSMLVLYPAWLILSILTGLGLLPSNSPSNLSLSCYGLLKRLLLMFLLSLAILNLTYCWEEVGVPLDQFEFRSHLLSSLTSDDADAVRFGNRFRNTYLGYLPVPFSSQYLLGFDSQKWEEELGLMRISKGQLVRRGVWYSPLESLFFKLPIGTLLLVSASLAMWLFKNRTLRLRVVVSVLPALFLLMLLSTQNGLNWAVRYSLPAIPLLILSIGSTFRELSKRRAGLFFIVFCLTLNLHSLFDVRPCYLFYANEFAGGPEGGRRHFIGSNYDWGQDLIRLRNWYLKRPENHPMSLMYYGVVPPSNLGLGTFGISKEFLCTEDGAALSSLPEPQHTFYLAISSNILAGIPGNILLDDGRSVLVRINSSLLIPERAIARVGYTLFVFRVVPDSTPSPGSLCYGELRSCLRLATSSERQLFVSP